LTNALTGTGLGMAGRAIRGRRPSAVLVAAVTALTLLSGCTQSVQGLARSERPDPTKVAGLEMTTGESGLRPGVPDAERRVEAGDGGEMDRLAVNTLADVEQYWREQMPANFDGKKFEPVKKLTSYDSTRKGMELCRLSTAGMSNAFYCSLDDSIAWDRGDLLPMLHDGFGPLAVVTVLAHEMGHAVQYKLGAVSGINQATPSIIKEQQADCYAGNFFRWMAEGKSEHFRISTGPGLNKVLATMFFIRDEVGASFQKQGAHGNAFDRVAAFQFGFSGGPRRCAQINDAEIKARITEKKFSGKDGGDLQVADRKNLDLLESSLRDAYKQSGATPPSIKESPASCNDAKQTSPASYCPSTNVIALNVPDLVKIGTAPKRGQKGGIGDFAAFAEIASRFSLSVQRATGHALDDQAAGQRTACLTGAWAATTNGGDGALHLSAGDLDEAVAELLADSSLIAADVNGVVVPSGFARVEAFRDGFFDGSGACMRKYS
jgi:predicted metalloprotease